MNTIFDNFSKDIDLSIFKESNEDPKTPLRRRYLSLVGLLEYVDIVNGDLTGRSLPEGMDEDDVKRMVSHSIGDLDTKQAMAQGAQGTQGTQGTQGSEGTQGTQGNEGTQGTQGTEGTEGTQGMQGTEGTEGTQGVQGE